MTFKQYYIQYLVERGFFENDANGVFDLFSKAPENDAMKGRWNDAIEGYPVIIKQAGLLSLHDHALDYIDNHIPDAWFRQLFV